MKKELSIRQVAEMVGGRVAGDGAAVVQGAAGLKDASQGDITFLANRKYKALVPATKAAAVIVGADFVPEQAGGKILVVCANPNAAFSKVIDFFAPDPVNFRTGVHPSASISPTAKIEDGASVGACAVVEDDAVVAAGAVVGAGSYVGHMCRIGRNTIVYPNVTIMFRCVVGSNVIIHSGTVIGADGYGFEAGPAGIVKIPQVGIVQIDDDVEVGANCTIDRARFGRTWIKRGVKMDDQVHVAHNVTVGEFSMLVGQCGIAGSTEIGRGVIVAAQAGINGHITLGDGVKVAGTAGVVKDVPPGEQVVGTPAESPREFIERLGLPKKVHKLSSRIIELEAIVAELRREIAKLSPPPQE